MICVYPADCKDFSNNGLGIVLPQSCSVTETLNGEWELTLIHPIDVDGKWTRLTEGCILRAPVPAAMTPQVGLVTQQYQTTVYDIQIYPETVARYAKEYNWKLITHSNMKDMFIDMVTTMTMSYSYKPVFILSFLDHMDDKGQARLEDVVAAFTDYYEQRIKNGLPAEKKPCIFTKGGYTEKDVERLILSMPFKRFEDMGFIHHAKHLGVIQLEKAIFSRLGNIDTERIRTRCNDSLVAYFG